MRGIQLTDYDLDIKVEYGISGKIIFGLVIGDILHQNQALILGIRPGELKENPALGVGLEDFLLSEDLTALQSEIRQQLEMDGQKVSAVKVTTDSITIDSKY